MIEKDKQSNIFIISGPSGVGKDTLMDIVANNHPDTVHIAITATTRKPRTNESNGINHYFYNETDFKNLINQNLLIEWAKVYDNFYGVPYSEITNNLNLDKPKKIDIAVPRNINCGTPIQD